MSAFRSTVRWSTRVLRHVLRVAAGLAGVAVAVAMGAVALLPQVGARAIIVTSGSMEPTINVGGLVIVQDVDPAKIAVGDIITFSGYTTDHLTTHRVIDRKTVAGRLHFRTQGDANDSPDVDLAPAEGIVGRVGFDVPYAGRALAELDRPELRYLVLGAVSAWFLVANALALREALRRPRAATGDRGTAQAAAGFVVALFLIGATSTLGLHISAAVLTDAAPITGNAFATGTW